MRSQSTTSSAIIAVIIAIACTSAGSLRAQCSLAWQPASAQKGPDDQIDVVKIWDPDGTGPTSSRLIAGGRFTQIGAGVANHVAAYDLTTRRWSTMGAGFDNDVLALATMPNNDLVAGGRFLLSGSSAVSFVARWNGTAWTPLGGGVNGEVHSLLALPNGDLVVGGYFTTAGGAPAAGIARWDGVAWHPFGSGMDGYVGWEGVHALETLANGDLVAGGLFLTAGGVNANFLARWNGTAWQPLGSGLAANPWSGTGTVRALLRLPNGDLVVGGDFYQAGGVAQTVQLARWDGSSWHSLGGIHGVVRTLATMPNGDLIAGGDSDLQRRDVNGAWHDLFGPTWPQDPTPRALAILANGALVVAGYFPPWYPEDRRGHLWTWDGAWRSLNWGIDGVVHALKTLPNGDVLAGGRFETAGGQLAHNVARWDGSQWHSLSRGINDPNPNAYVSSFALLGNGDIAVGGRFYSVSPQPPASFVYANLGRWNGTSWVPMQGVNGPVFALATLPNNDLVAGGGFGFGGSSATPNIQRWDGTAWSAMGSGLGVNVLGAPDAVRALLVLPNGDLVAGGCFVASGTTTVNNVARWTGSAWAPLGGGVTGSGLTEIRAMTLLANGDLIVGGKFTAAGGVPATNIARYDGSAWHAFANVGVDPNTWVKSLVTLPDGDVVVEGYIFIQGVPHELARWNGSSYEPFGAGPNATVFAMTTMADGNLLVGGAFTAVDGIESPYIARLATNCQAAVMPFGTGCAGAAGLISLTPMALPWVGGTFRAITTPLAANSFALGVFGLAPVSIGLPTLLPQGVAGCSLLVSPDLLLALAPAGGSVASALPIPGTAALAGQVVHHQTVLLELGPTLDIVAVRSSNGLTLTIGVL